MAETELVIEWEEVASFFVPGVPVPQPRAKARLVKPKNPKKKSFIQMYTPSDAKQWKNRVLTFGLTHRPRVPLNEPVSVNLCLYLPRLKMHEANKYRDGLIPCSTKPDIDNYLKAVLDAMTDSDWWVDDGRVMHTDSIKVYAGCDGATGARITVSTLKKNKGLFQ